MPENQTLILDLVEWVSIRPRSYEEVMEAWRTSCPRLSIREDACDQDLVVLREHHRDGTTMVSLTATGRKLLRAERGVLKIGR